MQIYFTLAILYTLSQILPCISLLNKHFTKITLTDNICFRFEYDHLKLDTCMYL